MERDKSQEMASLRNMLTWPEKQPIRDILLRRIFAIEKEIVYTNPFDDVDEVLYAIWKGSIPPYSK